MTSVIRGVARLSALAGGAALILSLLSPAHVGGAAQDPKLSYAQRFQGVKTWRIIYSYTSDSPVVFTEPGTVLNWHTRSERDAADVTIPGNPRARGTVQISGRAPSSASYNFASNSKLGMLYETRYDRGAGTPTNDYSLDLDLANGTYTFSITHGYFQCEYGGTRKGWDTDTSYGPETEEFHVDSPLPFEGTMPLPESGRVITGSYTWEEHWALEDQRNPDMDPNQRGRSSPLTGTIKWIIMPDDPVDVELIVEPQAYEAWVPEAGRDETTAGNKIDVKATLRMKDGSPLTERARRITYRLIARSAEPGVCLNWPVTGARATPDLKFDPAANPGMAIEDDGGTLHTPVGAHESATASVTAFDYGAFGTLLVTAELTNGAIVVGRVNGGAETQLRLPKRSPDSAIADAWKAQVRFAGPDALDDDRQEGNENHGDGLTAYEEYRGLIARGVHTRKAAVPPDPAKKDLVIRNDVGAVARGGLKLFENASGIRVVELDAAELGEARKVNANFAYGHGGDQHGLWLRNDTIANGNTAGENRPAEVLNKTPVLSKEVVIDLAFARASYEAQAASAKAGGMAMPYTLQDDIDNTVAHEIAHGVRAPHHGKETDYTGLRKLTPRMVDWKVYGVDGTLVERGEADFELAGKVGRPGNDASGDASCIMCYTNFYQWAAVGEAGGPYHFYAVGLQPLGTRFCTSAAGTGMNAQRGLDNGATLPSFFGDAEGQGSGSPVGNCLGAMKVKDW